MRSQTLLPKFLASPVLLVYQYCPHGKMFHTPCSTSGKSRTPPKPKLPGKKKACYAKRSRLSFI